MAYRSKKNIIYILYILYTTPRAPKKSPIFEKVCFGYFGSMSRNFTHKNM